MKNLDIKRFMVCKNKYDATPVFFDTENLAAEHCLKIGIDSFYEIDEAKVIKSIDSSSDDLTIEPKKMYFVDESFFKRGVIPSRDM